MKKNKEKRNFGKENQDTNNMPKSKGFSKEKRSSRKRSRSGILAFLFTVSDSIARALKRGFFGYIFADLYTTLNEKWKNGYIYNIFRRRKRKVRSRATLSHLYEKSLTSKKVSGLSDTIIHSHLRIWGVALLFFALSVIITTMLRYYYLGEEMLEKIIVGIVIVVFALPLIISRKELGEAMLSGRLTRFILTNVLNLNPTRFERSATPFDGSYFVAILCSVSLGFLTYFTHPIIIVNIAMLFVLFALIMSYPEIGLMFIFLMLPFSGVFSNPSAAILLIVGFTACGFLSKLLRGKRIMRFELVDLMILICSVLLLFGGVFTYGGSNSLHSAEVYFAFLFIYFLIVNMYIGKPAIYRAFKIVIVTATLASLGAIAMGGVAKQEWVDMEKFGFVMERLDAFFGNPNMLGVYVVLIFPLCLGQIAVSTKKISKVMYFLSSIVMLVCVVLTWSRGAWLGLIVATVVFLLLYNLKHIWIILLTGLSVPLWMNFVPQKIVERFISTFTMTDSSIQYRFSAWRDILSMISDHLFLGIGVGDGAFKNMYEKYVESGADAIVHSHNLFLQILIELGIIGLLLVITILIMFFQKCMIEMKNGSKTSKSRAMIAAGFASITSAIVMGFTDHIWYNYRVFLMFWIVFALTMSLSKVNVKERESTRIISNMTTADLEIDR